MSLLSKNAFICTETHTLIQEGVQKLCFVGIMSDRMIKSVQCSVNSCFVIYVFYFKSSTKHFLAI